MSFGPCEIVSMCGMMQHADSCIRVPWASAILRAAAWQLHISSCLVAIASGLLLPLLVVLV